MKTKMIFKQEFAYELKSRGFEIIDKIPNRYDNNLLVYIFEDNEKFQEEFENVRTSR